MLDSKFRFKIEKFGYILFKKTNWGNAMKNYFPVIDKL